MPEMLPSSDEAGFEAKTSDQALADLTGQEIADVLPIRPGIEVPARGVTSQEKTIGAESYSVSYFAGKVVEAQGRYDNMEKAFQDAQADADAKPEALATLRETADNAFVSLNTWKRRADQARESQIEPSSESEGGQDSSVA